MARYFFDSSALAKLYQSETGSAKVEALFREPKRSIIISRLTVVEINSVFARRTRMGDLTAVDATSLRNHFLNDIASGAFTVVAVTDGHYSEAERLIIRYPGCIATGGSAGCTPTRAAELDACGRQNLGRGGCCGGSIGHQSRNMNSAARLEFERAGTSSRGQM